MNKKLKIAILVTFLCLTPTTLLLADNTQTGSVYVAKEEIISGNLYVTGSSVVIDGTISGDLIAVAQSIQVNGKIEGDIIALAQEVSINGNIGGNARVVASVITINGNVGRNVNAFGNSVILGSNSRIGWDIYLAASKADSRGIIDGSLSGWSKKVSLSGQIGKNVNLTLDPASTQANLIISPATIINGNLSYSSNQAATISNQASIGGELTQNKPQAQDNSGKTRLWLWKEVFVIFSALTVGLALIYLTKTQVSGIVEEINSDPIKSILPGLVILFALPPISLILAITVIGLPLSLIVLSSWLILLYVGKIISAILIGKIISSKIITLNIGNALLWPLILGVLIVWLLSVIPYVGWIISLISAWIGLGGIWNYAKIKR